MDEHPNPGAHRHHMPDWGHALWEHYLLLQDRSDRHAAQIDRHTSALTRLKEKLMATQADLDALAADLGAAVVRIQDEITALQNANPELDLSGLQAAVAAVDALAPSDAPPAA